jgi:hypothetical protein
MGGIGIKNTKTTTIIIIKVIQVIEDNSSYQGKYTLDTSIPQSCEDDEEERGGEILSVHIIQKTINSTDASMPQEKITETQLREMGGCGGASYFLN